VDAYSGYRRSHAADIHRDPGELHWRIMMSAPRLYTPSLSVRRGGSLAVCASYDDGSTAARDAFMRTFAVQELTLDTVAQPPAPPSTAVVKVSVPGTGPAAWNREEVGYDWPVCATLNIPDEWATGLYAVQLSDTAAFASANTAFFIVRPTTPTPEARILFCWPWSTTFAYAGRAGDFSSLYDSDDPLRGRRVSLQRPLDVFAFNVDKRERTHVMPLNLWNFLQGEGHVLDPCTSFDLHAEADLLDSYNLFVSVGHDEYWSKAMRDHVEAFVASGGNAAFFSANTAWWQIRLEDGGQTLAGYKSGIEDPVEDPDAGGAATNWASSPTNRPENTLTGVSFRRGTMGTSTTPFTIVADPSTEPLLEGLTLGASVPSDGRTFFGMETDAADYVVDNGVYSATGKDGTPLNFKILGVADLPELQLRGGATMGYFTNVGCVFTGANTDWAAHLDEPSVATITRNVARVRSKRAHPPGAAWTLPDRTSPGSTWSVIDGAPAAQGDAVCSLFLGPLLLHQTDGSTQRGDSENPASGWTPFPLPNVPGIKALGTNLYSGSIYAVGTTGLQFRDDGDAPVAPWTNVAGAPGTCTAVAAPSRNPIFVLVDGVADQGLYMLQSIPNWIRLGSVLPHMRAMSGWDTKLFGISDDGRLYCRESSLVDVVWSNLGAAPPGGSTVAMAAYFGRLYALVQQAQGRVLMWRAAVSDQPDALRPRILFGRASGADFAYAVGPLPGSGGFETTRAGTIAGAAATHMAAAGAGRAFLYNATSRAGWLHSFARDGTYTVVRSWAAGAFGAWTSIASVPGGRVLFYDSASGHGVVGHFLADGNLQQLWSTDAFSRGWSHIVATWAGDLFFYNTVTGAGRFGSIAANGHYVDGGGVPGLLTGWQQVVPAGHRYLWFYRSPDGALPGEVVADGALAELRPPTFRTPTPQKFASGLLAAACANGLVLLHIPSTGRGFTGGFTANGYTNLRAYPDGAFGLHWQLVGALT
jgi:hypothetical protein